MGQAEQSSIAYAYMLFYGHFDENLWTCLIHESPTAVP